MSLSVLSTNTIQSKKVGFLKSEILRFLFFLANFSALLKVLLLITSFWKGPGNKKSLSQYKIPMPLNYELAEFHPYEWNSKEGIGLLETSLGIYCNTLLPFVYWVIKIDFFISSLELLRLAWNLEGRGERKVTRTIEMTEITTFLLGGFG